MTRMLACTGEDDETNKEGDNKEGAPLLGRLGLEETLMIGEESLNSVPIKREPIRYTMHAIVYEIATAADTAHQGQERYLTTPMLFVLRNISANY